MSDPIPRSAGAPTPEPSHASVAVGACAAYLILLQAAMRINTDSITAVVVSTLVFLAALIWLSSALARAMLTRRAVLLNLAVSGVIIVPLRVMFALGRVYPPWVLVARMPGVQDLVLVWFACSLGAALARLLRGSNMIPPVAAVLALVDIWTVLGGGPVGKAMQSAAPAAQAATRALTVPLPNPSRGAAPIVVVGFADFLFIAFFVAAICRFATHPRAYRRTVVALTAALCAYMALVMFKDSIPVMAQWPGLPALLPMAAVMIAVHWREFHYERSELFALLYAACFIAVIVAGFWYFLVRDRANSRDARSHRPRVRLVSTTPPHAPELYSPGRS